MRVLITGLCLSRNLGGPAMGTTLISVLSERLPGPCEFKFAVEPYSYSQEESAACALGVDIVPRFTLYEIVRTYLRSSKPDRPWLCRDQVRVYFAAWRESDVVVDMSGISYVCTRFSIGDAIRNISPFLLSKIFRKRFIRFIQSFGPVRFSGLPQAVCLAAEVLFSKIIFARGRSSEAALNKLNLTGTRIVCSPDLACLLEPDYEWVDKFLAGTGMTRKYVVMSPSSVIENEYSRVMGNSGVAQLGAYTWAANEMHKCGFDVIFLPHMRSETKGECDLEVCRQISAQLNFPFFEVAETLTANQAKALIGRAAGAVVSRYHALVAAASCDTPALAIGWNPKYQDLSHSPKLLLL